MVFVHAMLGIMEINVKMVILLSSFKLLSSQSYFLILITLFCKNVFFQCVIVTSMELLPVMKHHVRVINLDMG